VVSSVAREQADKGSDLVLALAIPRRTYYLGKLTGYLLVSLGISAFATVLIILHAPPAPAAMWGTSLLAELAIIVAASLLCMMTLSQVPAATSAAAGFYLLARTMGAVQLIAHGPLRDPNSVSSAFMAKAVDALAFMLPDLYRFTDTRWLLYGEGSISTLTPLLLQALIYVALLGAAGLFDLYRRNF
jgi:ABC-type Na+ efflux pump permease subunit